MLSVDRLKQAELQVHRAPWWGDRQGVVRRKGPELWLQAGTRVIAAGRSFVLPSLP